MTEPDSPEPAARPEEPTPESRTEPAPPDPAATHLPAASPFYGPPPANPFVPRYREPWVNPAKRANALVLGAAAAIVLLALGFLIGLGVSGGHGHGQARHDVPAVMRHPVIYPGMHAPRGWTGYRPRGVYRHPGRPVPRPAPSASHT